MNKSKSSYRFVSCFVLVTCRNQKTLNPSMISVSASKPCFIPIHYVAIRCVFRGSSSKALFSSNSFRTAGLLVFVLLLMLLLLLYVSRYQIELFPSLLRWTFRYSKRSFSVSPTPNSNRSSTASRPLHPLLLHPLLLLLHLLLLLLHPLLLPLPLLPPAHPTIPVQALLLVTPYTFSLFLTIPASKTAPPASSTRRTCTIPCISGTISRLLCKTSPTRAFFASFW